MNFDERVAKKYLQLKTSASARNLEFNLTLTSVRNLLKAKRCKYTGVILSHKDNADNKLTIDRIDPNKGYVIGNVVACSNLFNRKKNNMTPEDCSSVVKLIRSKKNGRTTRQ